MAKEKQEVKTVLLIEDSPTQARRLELILLRTGLAVLRAHSGEEGLKYARTYRPDAIVLDIELPGINGLEVCKELKKNGRTSFIPIIMLTHFNDPRIVEDSLQMGVIEYIPKDAFSDAVLIETLTQTGVIEKN